MRRSSKNGLPTTIARIKFDKKNARKHGKRNLEVITTSMAERGAARSIVIDEKGKLIAGEGAVRAAKQAGITKVIPVETDGKALVAVVRRGLSEKDKILLALEDNRASELSEWNRPVFAEISDLEFNGQALDLSSLWTDDEFKRMLVSIDSEKGLLTSEVKEPAWKANARELQKKWKCKTGQRWMAGRHMIICDDAMSVREVKADGACTDPPYGLSALEVVKVLEVFCNRAIVLCADKLAFGLTSLWKFRLDFIWFHTKSKLIYLAGKNMPAFHHNHCLVITRSDKVRTGWQRPRRDFSSVINLSDDGDGYIPGLPYAKATNLFGEMLVGFPWRTVVDPFLGSGGVLLACEAQNRKCVGIEKEPSTCAIALERCEQAGLKIKLQ